MVEGRNARLGLHRDNPKTDEKGSTKSGNQRCKLLIEGKSFSNESDSGIPAHCGVGERPSLLQPGGRVGEGGFAEIKR